MSVAPTIAAGRRTITTILVGEAVIIVLYWVVWFSDRSLLASVKRPAYYEFENAFPLADGWLALCCLGAAWSIVKERSAALGWLLCSVGAGVYLFGMDVLYDIENGIWGKGAGGAVELVINAATLGVSLVVLQWTWRRRVPLIAPVAGG